MMRFHLMLAGLVGWAGMAWAEMPVVTQEELDAARACPATAPQGERLVCRCDGEAAKGSVWGSGPYTSDSSICAAALHAGAIEAAGGPVVLIPAGRQENYPGSSANGITSRDWGAYNHSFDIHVARVAAPAQDAAQACPDSLGSEGELRCTCRGDAAGSVWGSGPYTGDSHICTAARHAGVFNGDAVEIVARMVDGQDSYQGSTANGITSRDWGRYGQSLIVEAASPAVEACSVLPRGVDRHTCSCPADDGTRGAIYGAGPYTADSDICTAARHDGALAREGGVVTVIRLPGLDSYGEAERNGIVPRGWGRYTSSILFDRN